MTKPTILSDIDEALKSVRPAGIRPWMDESVADQVRLFLQETNPDAPMTRQYWYEGVEMPIVTVPGWGVRINEAYRFRDPETGRFIDTPDA